MQACIHKYSLEAKACHLLRDSHNNPHSEEYTQGMTSLHQSLQLIDEELLKIQTYGWARLKSTLLQQACRSDEEPNWPADRRESYLISDGRICPSHLKWQHTLTHHFLMLLCNCINRETEQSENLGLGLEFLLGLEFSLKLIFHNGLPPEADHIKFLPFPLLQGRRVICAGLAFILGIIIQEKAKATDTTKMTSATLPFTEILLLRSSFHTDFSFSKSSAT